MPLGGLRAFALPAVFGAAAIGADVIADLAGAPASARVAAKLAVGLVVVRTLLTVRENLSLVDRVHELAFTDELTGLPNRRRLLEDLAGALDRGGPARTLTLLDLDGFKAFNDTFRARGRRRSARPARASADDGRGGSRARLSPRR